MANDNARQYSIGRPLQNVRLRNWPAGRVAQIKTAIQRLESILNQSSSSQINQPEKRELSNRVPIVQDITVRAGVQNFQITFPDPRGIDDLLFYEIQHDMSSVFSNPTSLTTAIPSVSIGGVAGGTTRYVRVRAVNSKFKAGPWSDTETFTTANFRINTTRVGEGALTTFTSSSYDVWTELATTSYSAVGGSVSVTAQVALRVDEDTPVAGADFFRRSTATIEFRILKDSTEIVIGRISAQANSDDTSATGTPTGTAVDVVLAGCIVSPFQELTSGSYTYSVEAKVISADTKRTTESASTSSLKDLTISVDLLDIIEVVGA